MRFWDDFGMRSLTLYYQLHASRKCHGFLMALTLFGDLLQLPSQDDWVVYIRSFRDCVEDPLVHLDDFIRYMKVCRVVYADDPSTQYRLDSYIGDIFMLFTSIHRPSSLP